MQPLLVLLDMEKEKKHEADVSVFIDDEQSDKVFHPIHSRPDCVVYPFKKDPTLHCESCWCVVCQEVAAQILEFSLQ